MWSDENRFRLWFDVEVAACRAMEKHGLVPEGTAQAVSPAREKLDASRILEIERTTKHDVIAFLTHVEELAGPPARWLHRGMTSSDVLDTSFALQLHAAGEKIDTLLERLIESFARRVQEHRTTPAIGRSHGIHAEPVSFGLILAGHMAELQRTRERLSQARVEVAVGKIAGAVGTYAHLSPEIEKDALTELGLQPETVATQIVARDRHAMFFSALASIAAAIERFATNVRHWQRTELTEAEEAFTRGQKGSSAMPHKRNPILSENLCGLARVVRAAVAPAFENVSLWHERDISHSSVERMITPDATATTAFMVARCTQVIEGLIVYPENLMTNLERTGGLWASEGVLLALVHAGLPRQEGYVMVQRNAMKAFEGKGAFRELLLEDAEIGKHVDSKQIEAQFELAHALSHCETIIERALSEVRAGTEA